jgi:hypothetical protein
MKRAFLLLTATLLAAPAAAATSPADAVWTLLETKVEPVYPELITGIRDRVENGWRIVEWNALVGFDAEPSRSQAANGFAFHFRGVPAELKAGMTFRVDYRYVRTSVGERDGKPYRHEWLGISFPGFCECRTMDPAVKVPDDRDEASGSIDFRCSDSAAGSSDVCAGYMAPGARPWSQVAMTFRWQFREGATVTGNDTSGTPLGGAGARTPTPAPVVALTYAPTHSPTHTPTAPPLATVPPPTHAPVPHTPTPFPGQPRPIAGTPAPGSGTDRGPQGACSHVFNVGVHLGAAKAAAAAGDFDETIDELQAAIAGTEQVFFFPPGELQAIVDALRMGAKVRDVREDLAKERRRFERLAADHCACDVNRLF